MGKLQKKNKNPKRKQQVKKNNRHAMEMALEHTLTVEEWEEVLLGFGNVCSLTGCKHRVSMEHFIPLSWGCEGSLLGNVFPLEKNLNSHKSNKNPFDWAKTQPEHIRQNFYKKVVPMLAWQNNMTVAEFKKYVNWCDKNRRTLAQVKADNEKGVTSKDLFYKFLEKGV